VGALGKELIQNGRLGVNHGVALGAAAEAKAVHND
jgi:hypothetical protein